MSGTNDDNRAGSADSEHSSDSFVQVSKEDAPAAMSEQLVADSEQLAESTGSGIPPIDDEEDIYGAGEETSSAPTDKEVRKLFVYFNRLKSFMCFLAVYLKVYVKVVLCNRLGSWEGPRFPRGDLMNTVSVSDLIAL